MKKEDIVYSLSVEDIQTVAIAEVGRELADSEIERVIQALPEQINWYEAILASFLEMQAQVK